MRPRAEVEYEGNVTIAGWEPWAPVLAALVFGVAIGWLIWGGRRTPVVSERGEPLLDEDHAPSSGDPCPTEMKIGAVESELRSARQLLEKTEDESADLEEDLTGLEKAISRINGRIKVVARSVNKTRF